MRTDDDFRCIVADHIAHIQLLYNRFADKEPVMELSLPSRKIYAYSCSEYMKTLSKRDQDFLKKEYPLATSKKRMLVFVRDYKTRTLKSASYAIGRINRVEHEVQSLTKAKRERAGKDSGLSRPSTRRHKNP